MWDWLSHSIELSKPQVNTIFSRVRDMELECERMTVSTIKEFGLSIDLKSYICEANFYVYSYNIIKDKRSWFNKEIELTKEIEDMMPPSLSGRRSKVSKELSEKLGVYFS
jgi:hypothetical protein